MRALDLAAHMRQVGTWVDWERTVDTFKAGDPQAEVRGIAVSWARPSGAGVTSL